MFASYLHANIALAIDGLAEFEFEAAAVNPKPFVRGFHVLVDLVDHFRAHTFDMQFAAQLCTEPLGAVRVHTFDMQFAAQLCTEPLGNTALVL